MNKSISFSLFASLFLLLGACSNDNNENADKKESTEEKGNMEGMDHSNMDMESSKEVPKGLKEAENPAFEVGSKAIIESDHMEGMKGAEATIAGAYDTTVYTISYTPKSGGEKVEDHKWVIQEELKDAGDEPLEPGAEVTVEASHMEGMDGVTAKIDSAEKTTVYMVDFTPTTGGKEIKNHKWVTESELSPAD